MGHASGAALDCSQVQAFLTSRFDSQLGKQELVVRFGQHVDDFRKDQLAAVFCTLELPIPTVLAIGEAFDGFYAVSTRVRGIPLRA